MPLRENRKEELNSGQVDEQKKDEHEVCKSALLIFPCLRKGEIRCKRCPEDFPEQLIVPVEEYRGKRVNQLDN